MDSTDIDKPAEGAPAEGAPASAVEPPPYNPNWTYPAPAAGQGAPPLGFQQPAGGYPPPQGPVYPPPAAGGAYPPPMNYPAYPPGQPASGSAQVTVTTTAVPQSSATHQVVVMNGCPTCHAGVLHEQFTTCGILLAIFCFPIGVFCCLVMRERVCTNCRATFS